MELKFDGYQVQLHKCMLIDGERKMGAVRPCNIDSSIRQIGRTDTFLIVSISEISDSCRLLPRGDSHCLCLLVQCVRCSLKRDFAVRDGAQGGRIDWGVLPLRFPVSIL